MYGKLECLLIGIMVLSCGDIRQEESIARKYSLSKPATGIVKNAMMTNAMMTNAMMTNAMMTNAMMTNAMMTNAMMTNAMMTNALQVKETVAKELDTDQNLRVFMKYLVECAMPDGEVVEFKSPQTNRTYTYRGAVGLAPQWAYSRCNRGCQRIVSACLLARTNGTGIQVRISLRSMKPPLSTHSDKEKKAFSAPEGVHLANLFLGPSRNVKRVASSDQSWMDYGNDPVGFRFCGDGSGYANPNFPKMPGETCPVYSGGLMFASTDPNWGLFGCGYQKNDFMCESWNQSSAAAYNCFSKPHCSGGAPVDPPLDINDTTINWGEDVITVYRANEASRFENVSGPGMTDTESPCTYRVIHEFNMPSCQTAWTEDCASVARKQCGDHDLFVTGAPLVMGDSRCINEVCDPTQKPECCKANSTWDAGCVDAAKRLCYGRLGNLSHTIPGHMAVVSHTSVKGIRLTFDRPLKKDALGAITVLDGKNLLPTNALLAANNTAIVTIKGGFLPGKTYRVATSRQSFFFKTK